jgi:hypothetical protein
MRLVLDTNVLARVVISPVGLAAELFDRVRIEHVLVSSSEMLAELSRVLRYKHLQKLHGLDELEIDEFVAVSKKAPLSFPCPQTYLPLSKQIQTMMQSLPRPCLAKLTQSAHAIAICTPRMSLTTCINGQSR